MANKNFIDIKNMEVVWRNIDDKFLRKQQFEDYSEEEVAVIYKVVNDFTNLSPSTTDDMIIYTGPCGYGLYRWNKDKWEIFGPMGLYKLYVITNASIVDDVSYGEYSLWFWDNVKYKLVELTGNGVYKTSKPAGSLISFDVGGVKKGTNIDLLNGQSYNYILDWIFFGPSSIDKPTHTDPSLTLSFADNSTEKNIEIGQSGLPTKLSDFKYIFTQGDILLNGKDVGNYYGEEDTDKSPEISINGGEFSSTPDWIETMPETKVTYKIQINYKQGDPMLNSDGSVYQEAQPAGTMQSSNTIVINPIKVSNKICYYGNDENVNSGNLDTISNKQQITIPEFSDGVAITEEFTLLSEVLNNRNQCVAVPVEYDGKFEIQYYDIIVGDWVSYKMHPPKPLDQSIYHKIDGEIDYNGKKYYKYATVKIESGKVARCRLKFTE